jgi:hypothetical protein
MAVHKNGRGQRGNIIKNIAASFSKYLIKILCGGLEISINLFLGLMHERMFG